MKIRESYIIIDDEFKSLIPPLQDNELEQLEKSILSEGIRDPIISWREESSGNIYLLDGHHRYEIGKKYDLDCEVIEKNSEELPTYEDVKEWIINNQFGRRNLSTYDRAILALKLKDIWADRVKENQRLRAEQINLKKWGISDENIEPSSKALTSTSQNSEKSITTSQHIDTYKEIGKAASLSHDTIARVQKIEKTVIPEIRDKVRRGDVSINEAYKVVRMPEAEQQKIAEKMDESGGGKLLDAIRDVKREEYTEKVENIEAMEIKKAEGLYDVIIIDPPWPMQRIERDYKPKEVGFDYPVMAIEEIKALEIPATQDCHLWLWATNKFLPDAFDILKAWKFKYICCFVWHKPQGMQPFNLPQYNCEFSLYAHRGNPEFIDLKNFFLCFNAAQGDAHSEKPQEFYDLVRRVTAGRRLDMFNRRPIDGFDTHGNQG